MASLARDGIALNLPVFMTVISAVDYFLPDEAGRHCGWQQAWGPRTVWARNDEECNRPQNPQLQQHDGHRNLQIE